jgi:hypothetical protein
MRKTVGTFAVVGALLATVPAFAADDSKPSEISNVIKAAAPYGEGAYRVLFMKAYDATLWTDAGQWSMTAPFALSLTYHFACSASDIVDRAMKEMAHDNPNIDAATQERYRNLMSSVAPAVKDGDETTSLYTPDGTVRFFRDGQLVGQVHDQNFAKAFFGIWLSPATTDPGLRTDLLRHDA